MPATLLEAVTTDMSKTLSLPPGGLGAEGNARRQRLDSGGLGEGQGGIWTCWPGQAQKGASFWQVTW